MPTYDDLRELIDDNLPNNTTGDITPAKLREVLDPIVDKVEEVEEGGGSGTGIPDGGTTGQVLTKQSATDGDADWETPTSGGSGGAGTATTFNGSIKFDKIPARYSTVNSSDISGAITPDATGAVLLGEYYLTVIEDGGGEPTLTGFKVYPNTEDYDTTVGNSTIYLFQNVNGIYYVGRLQQGLADAVNQAPTATSVSISGTAQEGETLTGSYTYDDNEGDAEGATQYQWYRADNGSGLNRAAISGATGQTYDLVTADVGKFIQYGVTPVAATGTSPGTQGLSSYTAEVTAIGGNLAPVASAVTISGTAKVGQTLTGSYTYFDNESDAEGASVKQWYRADNGSGLNRAAISGATNTTYMLVSGDLGKFIQYSVTPVAATGTSPGSAAVSSYTTAVLENVAPTVVSREATDEHTIVVTYSEIVNAASSTGNSFDNGSALTISGMTGTGTTALTFTITETMTSGDTITHAYSGTVVKDAANNNLAAFSPQAVTNSISSLSFLTLATSSGTPTESPTGTWTGAAGVYWVANEQITGGTDGVIQAEVGASDNEIAVIGLDEDSTLEYFASGGGSGSPQWKWFLFLFSGNYYVRDGAGVQTDTGVAFATGDLYQISVTGTAVIAEKSSNGGASWTTLYSYPSARTAFGSTLYRKLAHHNASCVIKNLRG